MNTQTHLIHLNPNDFVPEALALAAQLLREGALVAFPTETVYGLGANGLDEQAVQRIFVAKQRPSHDPIILHVASMEQVLDIAQALPDIAYQLADAFWPGALTLILPRRPHIPLNVTAGQESVAVRMPAHPIARALIEQAGVPIAAPSANRFSRPSPTRAEHVLADLEGRIDLILDGGSATIGVESSIVDLTSPTPRLLRPGGVSLEALRTFIPELAWHKLYLTEDSPAPASGTLLRHYAPRIPLTVYQGTDLAVLAQALHLGIQDALGRGQRVGVLLEDELMPLLDALPTLRLAWGHDDATRAARLFDALRQFESAELDQLFASAPRASTGLGLALLDRLTRAAEGRVIQV